ncbi:hypothetical protein AAC387_Pa11g2266 [Persea americana]
MGWDGIHPSRPLREKSGIISPSALHLRQLGIDVGDDPIQSVSQSSPSPGPTYLFCNCKWPNGLRHLALGEDLTRKQFTVKSSLELDETVGGSHPYRLRYDYGREREK